MIIYLTNLFFILVSTKNKGSVFLVPNVVLEAFHFNFY